MQAQNKYNADCTKAYAQLLANIAREIVQFSQDFNMPIFPDDVAGLVHGFGDHLGAHFEEHFSGDDFDNAWSWAASTVNAAIKDECETTLIGMLKPTVYYGKGEKVRMVRRYAEQYLATSYAYNAEDEDVPLVFDLMAKPIALRDPVTNPVTVNLLEQISAQNIRSALSVEGGAK